MKTKTITTGIMALLIMLFTFSFALAENASINDSAIPMLISAPSIDDNVNDSEATGNLFWKKMDAWFTFNQEKKTEKELKLAELELIRAKIAAKNNNSEAMIKALEAHQKLINKIQNRVSKFDEKKNSTDKLIGINRAIEAHETKIERLNNLIANNSNLSEEEIARIQMQITKAENNTAHLRDVANAKMERFELRDMAMNANKSNKENSKNGFEKGRK